jgi:hypothetical protein
LTSATKKAGLWKPWKNGTTCFSTVPTAPTSSHKEEEEAAETRQQLTMIVYTKCLTLPATVSE